MNWEGCTYRNIAEKISDVDIEKMIDVIIENCDNNSKCYEDDKVEDFFRKYICSEEFFRLIEKTAKRESKKHNSQNAQDYKNLEFLCEILSIDEDIEEQIVDLRRNQIFKSIIDQIEKEAKKKRAERVYSRINVGEKVDFESCISHANFLGKILFCKDGGWGIANEDGIVVVKNHLIHRPAREYYLYEDQQYPFQIIQDRDTYLYGVLSLNSFREVIHCLYDEIKRVTYWIKNKKKYIVKVKKNGKWGCYDENCAFIVDCKYDEINIINGWIECCRDGQNLYSETDFERYEAVYSGLKDLYDLEGKLIIGGYNHFELEKNKYFKFYFGTTFGEYIVKKTDLYGNEIELERLRLNYDNSVCLALDSHFRTIIESNGKYYSLPVGKIFESKEDLELFFPKEVLLTGLVDLSDYNAYIYLKKKNGDVYMISEYVEPFSTDLPICPINEVGQWNDIFFEDDEVVIVRMSEDNTISWRTKVNEIGPLYSDGRLYRIGDKVGFFSLKGISDADYSAVTIDSQNEKTYVATIQFQKGVLGNQWDPNYIQFRQLKIKYFELTKAGDLIRMEDNWKVFNPKEHQWFPSNFLEKNGILDDRDCLCENNGNNTSYEKYGGYNGYDDDTIDYGFDGYPEATWNVD